MNKPKYLLVSNSEQNNDLIKALIEENPNIDYLGIKAYNNELGKIINHYNPDVLVVNVSLDKIKKQTLKSFVKDLNISILFSSFRKEVETVPIALKTLPSELVKPAIQLTTNVDSLKVFLDEHFDQKTGKSTEYIFLRCDRKMVKVSINEIIYIEALADYIKVFLVDGKKLVTQKTMKNILDELPSNRFIRLNRSNIVNGSKVDSFNSSSVFIGEKVFPIGKDYKESFKALLKSY